MSLLRPGPAYERLDTGDLGDGYEHRDNIELMRHTKTASTTDFDSIFSSISRRQSNDEEHLLPKERAPRSLISGWRVGAIAAAITTISIMLLNVGVTGWVLTNGDYEDFKGWRVMYRGSCSAAKENSRWVHFAINSLSTVLLGSSNYCMQVLSSPTRTELVRAHNKRFWLHLGVPNTRNLFHIGKDRALLWILLFLSSVPLHLIFNSVIFANIQANNYAVLPVTPDFLNGGNYNTSGLIGLSSTRADEVASNATVFRTRFLELMSQPNRTMNLSTADCLDTYGNQYISKYGDVFLVQDEVVWHSPGEWGVTWAFDNATLHPNYYSWAKISSLNDSQQVAYWGGHSRTPNSGDSLPFFSYADTYPSYNWRCPSRTLDNCDITKKAEVPDKNTWAPYGSSVTHCVVELVDEQCRIQFSAAIAAAVVACNVVKALCMLTMIFRNKENYLVTMGDAIACFLEHPDPETKGRCLHDKALIQKEWEWMSTNGLRDPKTIRVEPEVYAPRSQRWGKAASKRRWWMTYLLYTASLVFAAVAIPRSIAGMPTSAAQLWAVGFGELKGNNLLTLSTSVTGSILLANVPQALLSYLYVAFNALYTCMLIGHEWARYYCGAGACNAKPLRVTTPRGGQRSTYWLQLPYRYALPLTVASALLHWLASQSLFSVSVTITDVAARANRSTAATATATAAAAAAGTSSAWGPRSADHELSTCGYSPVAIILTTALGGAIVLGGVGLAWRRYPARMPLASSCSAAISAGCHPPEGDEGAALAPVRWGAVSESEGGKAVGHVTFTSLEVTEPLRGRKYS